MSTHSGCSSIRRSEYLSLFLQLRQPLASTLPFFERWHNLTCSLVGDIHVFGSEAWQGGACEYPRTALSQLSLKGLGSLGLASDDAVPAPKAIEFLVHLTYNDYTVCCGFNFGPSVLVGFGLSYMSERAIGELDSCIIDWFAECAQMLNARYGIIDIADSMETGVGQWLGATDQLYASFQRRLMRRMWAREVGEAPKGIGVFWANLFGPEMVERLGGLPQMNEELQRLSDARNPQPLRECPHGTAIVLLSGSITDFMYPRIGITWAEFDRAEWLHRRLAHAGLLPGYVPVQEFLSRKNGVGGAQSGAGNK